MGKILHIVGFLIFCMLTASAVEMPQFKSGISAQGAIDVDFNVLAQKAGTIYDIKEQDGEHIIWKFSQTSGDWAFASKDGIIIIASISEFNLNSKDRLNKELSEVISTIKLAEGTTSDLSLNYYADESKSYNVVRYKFDDDFNLNLGIPDCRINQARLTISGFDNAYDEGEINIANMYSPFYGMHFYIDGKEVSGCDLHISNWGTVCKGSGISCGPHNYQSGGIKSVSLIPVDITANIPYGLHTISSSYIDNEHEMVIEAITSQSSKPIVLYNDPKTVWVESEKLSSPLMELSQLIS